MIAVIHSADNNEKEKLMKKGFVVGSVEFRKRDSNLGSNKAGSKPAEKVKSSKNLDIIG